MKTPKTLAAIVVLSASLTACSGGGGGPVPTPPQPTPTAIRTASPTPSPSPTPAKATASGTVVDNASNAGIAGVTVAIAPGSSSTSTSPAPVTTTAANGSFSFTAAPGNYLLVIGSNSPTDTRSTYHGEITLAAGANALKMGVPSPEPDVTLSPAQASGNYRLETLSTTQSSCLTGANQGRTADSLPLLVPDQSLLEIADALGEEEVAQNTDTPSPLFGPTSFEASFTTGGSTSENFHPCSQWTGTNYSYVSGNPPYALATSPTNTLYGADLLNGNASIATFGAQTWGKDPRPF